MGAFLPEQQRLAVEALLRAGLSDLAVHRETGVARDTVARYRTRLGLPGYRAAEDGPACRHGHPFPDNAARDASGWLFCRECRRIRDRRMAAARYVPAFPDEVAVERAMAGDPPERLTPRERHAAIARLVEQRVPAAVIAERVHCSRRTVHRARSRRAIR